MEKLKRMPECELGNKIENHGANRLFYSKFGYDAVKVRPCEWYREESKDCIKYKSMFRDLYVSRRFFDRPHCAQWENDYRNCLEFRKSRSLESFEKVLNSEKKRIEERSNAVKRNDVWRLRKEPPREYFDCSLDQFPKSNSNSPFDNYEKMKESRKNRVRNEDGFMI